MRKKCKGSLSLCISISLLRPYTFFSRSPLVFKTLFENACELQRVVLYLEEQNKRTKRNRPAHPSLIQAVIVRTGCSISNREPAGPGLAPFRTLTRFMQVIYWLNRPQSASDARADDGRRPTVKSANPDPQILPQCNISSKYPL